MAPYPEQDGVIALRDHNRFVAVCVRCESVYAAKQLLDGTIRPIGTAACSCGSDDFRALR
ncbi:hypothetical protein NP511_22125 (plasmid) [Natrinema thermotolerans]|uniref:Uncharacterized protein n=1 Tax=Natrinema thermotolerans TaxID=121872 RepID=A0AAF0PJF3_9EURY|nr:hypothetical protein [Natrinema thermotolerans]QCC57138.1 hypothetical protein DVR14_00235 [Natrinema thermotolerans]WMT10295.1 hypothetical protein NP511_22125 [Natrinema thermotolerans]